MRVRGGLKTEEAYSSSKFNVETEIVKSITNIIASESDSLNNSSNKFDVFGIHF